MKLGHLYDKKDIRYDINILRQNTSRFEKIKTITSRGGFMEYP